MAAVVGCDTIASFTPAGVKAALAEGFQFIFQYVSLGAPSPGDITIAKRDVILGGGAALGLVQHVLGKPWDATAQIGAEHGAAAAAHAKLVEYPQGAMLGMDMENVLPACRTAIDCVRAWAKPVKAAGYRVLVYVGFCSGLSSADCQQLAAEGTVDGFWKDFGDVHQRPVAPGFGFMLVQSQQVMDSALHFWVDRDTASMDLAGRVLILMAPDKGLWTAGVADAATGQTEDAHADPPDATHSAA